MATTGQIAASTQPPKVVKTVKPLPSNVQSTAKRGIAGLGQAVNTVNNIAAAPGRAAVGLLTGLPKATQGFGTSPQAGQGLLSGALRTVGGMNIPIVSQAAQVASAVVGGKPAPRLTPSVQNAQLAHLTPSASQSGIQTPSNLAFYHNADRAAAQQSTTGSAGSVNTGVQMASLTPDQQKEADARQYLQDEDAASLAMGSKNLVSAMNGSAPQNTTQAPTTDTSVPTPSATASQATTQSPYDTQLKALQDQLTRYSSPSAEEQALQQQVSQLKGDAQLGISDIEGQGRGIPLSLVRGEQAKLGEQANLKIQTLQDQLANMIANRTTQQQAAQQAYSLAASQQQRQDQLSQYDQTRNDKLTAPIEVGGSLLQYDPSTKTYSTKYSAPEKPVDGFSLSPGEARYSADGTLLASAPASASGDAYTLSPGQNRYDASGNLLASGGAATPNDTQYKAYGFATRMDQSSKIIDNLDQNFTGAFGQGFKLTPEFLKSDDRKSIEQAESDFVNALLRRESGAAISPAEFANAQKQYFPQAGDSEAILAQKKANRDTSLNAIQLEAQNVYAQQGQTVGGQSDPREQQLRSSGFSDQEINEYLGKANAGRAVSGSIVSVPLGNKQIQVSDEIASPLAMADADYFRATGKHIEVSEGLRSHDRQAMLYQKFKSGQGGRAAPPGQSFHETGKAIDVSGDWQAAAPYLQKYGFKNNLPDDRHHFSVGEWA